MDNYGPINWECFSGSLFFSQGTDCLVLSFDKSRKVASLRDAAQKYATGLAQRRTALFQLCKRLQMIINHKLSRYGYGSTLTFFFWVVAWEAQALILCHRICDVYPYPDVAAKFMCRPIMSIQPLPPIGGLLRGSPTKGAGSHNAKTGLLSFT
jgi:hypothetical protein